MRLAARTKADGDHTDYNGNDDGGSDDDDDDSENDESAVIVTLRPRQRRCFGL